MRFDPIKGGAVGRITRYGRARIRAEEVPMRPLILIKTNKEYTAINRVVIPSCKQ